MRTSETVPVRSGHALDLERLVPYLRDHIPGVRGAPEVEQFPIGNSNLTYLLSFGDRRLVLRRPPVGTKPRSGHQMWREYRLMNSLRPLFPHVPTTYLHCTDSSVIGAEFYVMEWLPGVILKGPQIPEEWGFGAAENRRLCLALWDRLIELHRVDYRAAGLGDLGRPVGYVRRQIEGWSRRLVAARTPDVSDFAGVRSWLVDRLPKSEVGHAVIHGDYRFDNCVLDAGDPFRIVAVLDWELGTVGDPLMDLGNSLAYWVQPDDPDYFTAHPGQPSTAAGMLTRDEILAYYCSATGVDMDPERFRFYLVYGYFRNTVILQQIYYRYYHGQTREERFSRYGEWVNLMERHCLGVIDGA